MQEFGWQDFSAASAQKGFSLPFSFGVFQKVPVSIMGDMLHCLWAIPGARTKAGKIMLKGPGLIQPWLRRAPHLVSMGDREMWQVCMCDP